MWRDIGAFFDLARKLHQVEELIVAARFPRGSHIGEELGLQDVLAAYFGSEVCP